MPRAFERSWRALLLQLFLSRDIWMLTGDTPPILNERMRRRHLCWTGSVTRVLRTATMQSYGCNDPLYAEVLI